MREEGGAVFWFRFVTTDVYFFLLILAMREGAGGGVCVCVCVCVCATGLMSQKSEGCSLNFEKPMATSNKKTACTR